MKRLAVGGLVLVALVAGCKGETEVPRDADPAGPVKAGDTYVALGDSYTSGPRLGKNTGPKGCEQTDGNYPHLVAAELDLELVDVSCGAATTDNLSSAQTPPNGSPVSPQLSAVTEDADLVTLSIGGNDGRVFGHLVTTCVGLAVKDPDGAPCTDIAAQPDNAALETVDELADRIEAAVVNIRGRAPDARIVVVGYPRLFPEDELCDRLPLAAGDLALANDLTERLVRAQEKGARAADAEFVDVYSATTGHDICARDPWMAGVVPERPALEYHPYAEEQQEVARLLKELLTS